QSKKNDNTSSKPTDNKVIRSCCSSSSVVGKNNSRQPSRTYPVADKSAETMARAIFCKWLADGCRWPEVVLSGRGGEFENKIMEETESMANIKHISTK
ncbi:unnamed protein product, partial [Haemonchus placei]|uniref:Integrase catalytic domain-containing protein n=1 Tax=Haemonchus placei TaxID=6290 RepID=A0A0N4WWH0_HAEPC